MSDDDTITRSIDLQKFCGNEDSRGYLHQPFSHGAWTYATDGHVMVRVPRLEEWPEVAKAPATKAEDLFAAIPPDASYVPLPRVDIPEVDETEECEICDGRGTEHDCPRCDCLCTACNGTGHERRGHGISIGIGEAALMAEYVLLLQSLPNIQIVMPLASDHLAPAEVPPMAFRFDGGDGLLTPLRSRSAIHIQAEEQAS